jgi:AcrR family transcriptional regulator
MKVEQIQRPPTGATEPSRREQRRVQHHDLSRTQLLDAAEEVFGRKGFHATSLKEIAELAEFSVGSVYSFFENKDDLFRQIFARRGAEFMPEMAAVVGAPGAAADVLRSLVEFEVGYFRRLPSFGRLYLRFSSAAVQTGERLADELVVGNYAASMRLQAELFARGQADGTLCAGDPAVLARLLSGLVAAYQALDPAVMGDEVDVTDPMTLEEFHRLVVRTFVVKPARRKA